MLMEDVDPCRNLHQRFRTIYFSEGAIYQGFEKGFYRNVRLMARQVISACQYFQK
jgi:hypothetical protein